MRQLRFKKSNSLKDAWSFPVLLSMIAALIIMTAALDASALDNSAWRGGWQEQEIPFDRGVAFSDEFGFTPRTTFVGEPGDGPIETEVLGQFKEFVKNQCRSV